MPQGNDSAVQPERTVVYLNNLPIGHSSSVAYSHGVVEHAGPIPVVAEITKVRVCVDQHHCVVVQPIAGRLAAPAGQRGHAGGAEHCAVIASIILKSKSE